MKEIYKDIKGYEGLYQVSNLGNVKSLERIVKGRRGEPKRLKGAVRKLHTTKKGYKQVSMSKNGTQLVHQVHILVAIAFLGHKPNGQKLVVDHINNNQLDNRLDNLQIVSHYINITKDQTNKTGFTGVRTNGKKFSAQINIDGIRTALGTFNTPEEASKVYQEKLKEVA